MPSGEVITRFVPLPATATNKESSGDQHTEFQSLDDGAVLCVHVMPSGDVIADDACATATNKESSGDQHTDV